MTNFKGSTASAMSTGPTLIIILHSSDVRTLLIRSFSFSCFLFHYYKLSYTKYFLDHSFLASKFDYAVSSISAKQFLDINYIFRSKSIFSNLWSIYCYVLGRTSFYILSNLNFKASISLNSTCLRSENVSFCCYL